MEVLSLTVFLSLCLAAWFTLAFVRSALRRHSGAWEREALLPLASEDQAGSRRTDESLRHESRQNPH